MAFYLLLPGAGGAAFYWRDVVMQLAFEGHEAVAVDFPGADKKAGLPEYADIATAAGKGHSDIVLVAQSMGGFTAPVVASRLPVTRIVLVNAMIPVPGERAKDWGDHTGSAEARKKRAEKEGYSTTFELETYFLHDLPPDAAQAIRETDRNEAEISFTQPCEFTSWPAVPIDVIIAEDDRLFPADFQERVARERLGKAARITRIAGGHLVGLSHPELVVERLLA